MQTNSKIVIDEICHGLLINWGEPPINYRIAILWRGNYIKINIKVFAIEFGMTRNVKFTLNEKEYNSSITKCKYMGGGHGDKLPVIETSTHILKISGTLNSVTLSEELKQPLNNTPLLTESPIIVFYPS